ncbi:hypothetical protein [Streptomyces sp. NPDC048411]|uniref:hypothetical protein n=1 Tax=Streptomyces sp. NPDC048411 TaxID=3157206 RepID=UPI003452BD73
MLSVVTQDGSTESGSLIDEIAREGARRGLAAALEAEVNQYIAELVTRGVGSPAAALAMMFKLVESAQARWRPIAGAHLAPLVRAGSSFENGVLVEREKAAAA